MGVAGVSQVNVDIHQTGQDEEFRGVDPLVSAELPRRLEGGDPSAPDADVELFRAFGSDNKPAGNDGVMGWHLDVPDFSRTIRCKGR